MLIIIKKGGHDYDESVDAGGRDEVVVVMVGVIGLVVMVGAELGCGRASWQRNIDRDVKL
eukprot:21974-Eustigmatos_ZCMA.PRE.1